MTCSICQTWCADDFGWCAGELECFERAQESFRESKRHHDATAHKMRVEGGSWVCEKGHKTEAAPLLVMEAAEVPRLEGF